MLKTHSLFNVLYNNVKRGAIVEAVASIAFSNKYLNSVFFLSYSVAWMEPRTGHNVTECSLYLKAIYKALLWIFIIIWARQFF